MNIIIDQEKKIVKSGALFRGTVSEKTAVKERFLRPEYNLAHVFEGGQYKGSFVFRLVRGWFKFEFFRFRDDMANVMDKIHDYTVSLVKNKGLVGIEVEPERKGALRKFLGYGFSHIGENRYRKVVC